MRPTTKALIAAAKVLIRNTEKHNQAPEWKFAKCTRGGITRKSRWDIPRTKLLADRKKERQRKKKQRGHQSSN